MEARREARAKDIKALVGIVGRWATNNGSAAEKAAKGKAREDKARPMATTAAMEVGLHVVVTAVRAQREKEVKVEDIRKGTITAGTLDTRRKGD